MLELAYTELLKLTWTIHDPFAFCPGKWEHQLQLQRQIALINWHTPLPKFRVGARWQGMQAVQVIKLNTASPWSEPVAATFILISFYQEKHHIVLH
ncbi:Uncharacterized protein TCM_026628 [Theobroma cacao]|uniref:Uncharacterized protein n=1 Tax=Theobroma cacao TaxID=3641 RepID=A0A061F292_THECC|nr:Uncharacterized protein TCM_026628 [Theobroma cacao]